jgi:alanine racemase
VKVHRYGGSQEELRALYTLCQSQSYDLVVDSRLVNDPQRTLFFALSGERTDGHDFIEGLYELGVRSFVIRSRDLASADYVGADFYECDDPLCPLQELAAYHRSQFPDLPVVAITGSNGKTIVKDWLAQFLGAQYRVCASPRSYNSQIGVPLSVWQLTKEHEIAVFEVGISQPGEMHRLHKIVRPTAGVLTNIGTAHLSNFTDQRQLAGEKIQLFKDCKWVLIPQTATEWAELLDGSSGGTTVAFCDTVQSGRLIYDNRTVDLPKVALETLPAVYQQNARLVVAAAYLCRMPAEIMAQELQKLAPLSNRLERREGRDGGPVINDSYSNDLSALAAAITFAESQDPYGSLTLVLGEVQPLPNLKDKLVALFAGRVHRLIVVGGQLQDVDLEVSTSVYAKPEDMLSALPTLDFSKQTVLIKGGSSQRLSRVADALSRQLHRTLLRVDLTALRHNYLAYRRALPREVGMIVMTKASAYGSGALPVARLLQNIGADYLAVAYPEEGRALREGGIDLPIMVLNAERYSFEQLTAYRLEPVVHNEAQLRLAAAHQLPVHLELDTGMARLGFSPAEFTKILNSDLLDGIPIRSIFTHLAASEDATHDDFTRQQLATFDCCYSAYRERGYPSVARHALNSNGISRFHEAHYEMVRLGIGLYGIGDDHRADDLQPALSLTTTITALSTRSATETIGYGRRGKLTEPRTIAVLSIGYADGLPRLAGEGRFSVSIRGQLARTVGAICMDMCMVDVTHIVGAQVQDEATIFGPDHPIELLATTAQTIPYEILTGIGQRVHRVYTGE